MQNRIIILIGVVQIVLAFFVGKQIPQKPCETRSFTVQVTEVGEVKDGVYNGKGLYIFPEGIPEVQPFTYQKKFKVGDFINGCTNIYISSKEIKSDK